MLWSLLRGDPPIGLVGEPKLVGRDPLGEILGSETGGTGRRSMDRAEEASCGLASNDVARDGLATARRLEAREAAERGGGAGGIPGGPEGGGGRSRELGSPLMKGLKSMLVRSRNFLMSASMFFPISDCCWG